MKLPHFKKIKLNQRGDHVIMVAVFIFLFGVAGTFFLIHDNAEAFTQIRLGSTNGALCLDNYGGSNAPKNLIDIWSCNTNIKSQGWHINVISGNSFTLQSDAGNVCLDDIGDGGKGSGIQTYSCNRQDKAQVWSWQNHQLEGVYSHVCLNDPGGSKSNKTPLIVWTCSGGSNAIWFEVTANTSTGGAANGGSGTLSSQVSAICKQYVYSTYSCTAVGDAINQVSSKYSSWIPNGNYTQLACLGELWNRESGFRADIWNGGSIGPYYSGSGAYGVAQADPYSKYPKAGQPSGYGGSENPNSQIQWGLNYIYTTYHNPCEAWASEEGIGSY